MVISISKKLALGVSAALVLSSDFIQPAIQGPWVSGIQRLGYTVGVEGRGQRTTRAKSNS